MNYSKTTSNIPLIAISNNIHYLTFLSCSNHNGIAKYIVGVTSYTVQGIV